MIEDSEGSFILFTEHQNTVATLETQIHAIATYVAAVQTYVEGIK